MALKGAIARRYAEAVFDIGQQHGTIERWREDIQFLNELFSNRKLAFILSEPKLPFATKQNVLQDLAGQRVQQDALGLGLLIIERGLVELMPRLATEFARLYDVYKNQAKATITTALPLDGAEQADIVAALQRVTGKNIQLETKVDPSILGGVVARVGDTLIDGSVARRLAILREQIATGVMPVTSRS